MKRKRIQILNIMPDLEDTKEMQMFLTASGSMVNANSLPAEETHLGAYESLYSASDSESSSGEEDGEFD